MGKRPGMKDNALSSPSRLRPMPPNPSRLPTPLLIAFGLVNLPLSMLMSPTAAVLPNFYLDYSAVTLAGLATATLVARVSPLRGTRIRATVSPARSS